MILRQFCYDQIARLYRLKGYPRVSADKSNTAEVSACLRDLVDALAASDSEEQAKAAIDTFCREPRDCPFPAEIRSALLAKKPEVDPRSRWGPIGWLCPECDSWGYVQGDQCVQRCGACENGRLFPQVLLDMMNHPDHGKPATGLRSASVPLANILSGKSWGKDQPRLRR